MNANDIFKAVMELNLEPIKAKLMHVESGEGWNLEKANAVEKEYRRFLCLMKMFPHEATAPLVDVDTFWHYHILDTMKYAVDCEQAFGYFLHHYPYVGLRGEGDEQFRLDSGERMRTLYEATFGEAYPVGPVPSRGTALDGDKFYARLGNVGATFGFCAGPETQIVGRAGDVRANTAFCAGPENKRYGAGSISANTAFCAGPETKFYGYAGNVGTNTAFCAGPETRFYGQAGSVGSNIAFCAGPESMRISDRAGSISANTAFCAGPESQPLDARNGAQATLAA